MRLRMTVPLAFGFGVQKSYLDKANSRSLLYVRWMGFAFAPLHLIFIYTDPLVAGTFQPHTEWARIPIAILLFIPALITLMKKPLIGARLLLVIHAIAWQFGQAAVCYLQRDNDTAVYSLCLVFLAAPFLCYYEAYIYIIISIFAYMFYLCLITLGLGLDLMSSQVVGHLITMLASMLIGCVLAIVTWERNLREWNHTDEIEENERRNQKELKMAEKVQRGLLPQARYSDDHVSIDFCYLPANNVGGDLLDIIRLEDGVYGLLIADVSGHGFASALISSMMKMLVHALERTILHHPGELMQRIDQLLHDRLHNEFITAVYGVVNIKTGTFEYSTAGHEAPIVYSRSMKDFRVLPQEGRALGIFKNSHYRTFKERLNGDEILFFFTDGCFEGRSPEGTMLGFDEFARIVGEAAPLPFDSTVARIVENIRVATGGMLDDDLTLLACRLM